MMRRRRNRLRCSARRPSSRGDAMVLRPRRTRPTPADTPARPRALGPTGRRRWAAGALAVAVLALAGCAQSKPSSSSDDASGSAGASAKPLTVGISLPLTGDFSQPGGEARRGYEVWRDMVNAKGGVLGRQVKLTITDDASNQDTVVSDYTKLITQNKVDLLLGTFSSLLNFPASAVAEKNGMLYVEPAGGAPKIFDRGFTRLFFAQPATAPHPPWPSSWRPSWRCPRPPRRPRG